MTKKQRKRYFSKEREILFNATNSFFTTYLFMCYVTKNNVFAIEISNHLINFKF